MYVAKSDPELADWIAVAKNGDEAQRIWQGLVESDITRVVQTARLLIGRGFRAHEFWSAALETVASKHIAAAVTVADAFVFTLGGAFVRHSLSLLANIVNRYFSGPDRQSDAIAWTIWDRAIVPAAEIRPSHGDNPLNAHYGSPIGILADCFLRELIRLAPKDFSAIPPEQQDRLKSLISGTRPGHVSARFVLAPALGWLYGLNRDLVASEMLPKLDWSSSEEARNLWLGFLYNPRVSLALWPKFRPAFLQIFSHSPELGDFETQLSSFFAWLLLHPEYELTQREARDAFSGLSDKARERVAWYWWRQSDSATDYGAALYRERLKYLLTSVWPLDREFQSAASSENLARLAACCSSEFADAVETIAPLLLRLCDPHDVLWALKDKDVVDRFPDATLKLLDLLIGDELEPWSAPDLRHILDRILEAGVAAHDSRILRLVQVVRRFE